MGETPIALNADATSLAAAQANQLASTKIMVQLANDNLKSIYLTGFNNWKVNVDAGRIPNTNPPHPPLGYAVSTPDANGFQWPVIGTAPVCDMPPIPEDHFTPVPKVTGTIEVGHKITGKWFQVGPNDAFPADGPTNGTTPPVANMDNPTELHTYQKYPTAVGAGWYLQLT